MESVEALTIVLAVGITRGWRTALLGAVALLPIAAIYLTVALVAVATLRGRKVAQPDGGR